MQVGTTKDQGLYNKPSAAVHPGALAAETLPQYSTIPQRNKKDGCFERTKSSGEYSTCKIGSTGNVEKITFEVL